MPEYSQEPGSREVFTKSFDVLYNRFARLYDLGVQILPSKFTRKAKTNASNLDKTLSARIWRECNPQRKSGTPSG